MYSTESVLGTAVSEPFTWLHVPWTLASRIIRIGLHRATAQKNREVTVQLFSLKGGDILVPFSEAIAIFGSS